MSQHQKWVDLFEQVIGRPPTAREYQLAKERDFDLKAIKEIAALSKEPVKEVNPIPTLPIKKKNPLFVVVGLALLVLVIGGGFYGRSQTKPEVQTAAFLSAANKGDYQKVANFLSQSDQKWTEKEAKSFVAYLEEQEGSLEGVMDQVALSANQEPYTDERGNKLLGLVEDGKKWIFFPDYHWQTYPVEVTATSNLEELTIDGQTIETGQAVPVASLPFATKELEVLGKTKLGEIETKVAIDLAAVKENQLDLDLALAEKRLEVTLPLATSEVEKVTLLVNDQEVAEALSATLQVLDSQQLDVKARFVVGDQTFETQAIRWLTSSDEVLNLPLRSEDKSRLEKLRAKKEEPAPTTALWNTSKAQQLAQFMVDWGNSMDQPGYQNWGANGGALFWQGNPLDASYSETGVSGSHYTIVAVYSYNRGNGLYHIYHFAILPDGKTTVIYSEGSFGSGYRVSKLQTDNGDLLNGFAGIVHP